MNKKLRIICLYDLLLRKTDTFHGLNRIEIASKLEEKGIRAERKTIYEDIKALKEYGVDIISQKESKETLYSIGKRDFEIPELKLLVDAVQSSKFITRKKSDALIEKIEGLASIYEASELQRQVYTSDRAKTENEKIYYVVDMLHEAINANKSIVFKYLEWTVDGKKKMKHDGKTYHESPWALLWDDSNYYLVAYDEDEKKIKHYRVDKIKDPTIVDKEREGKNQFDAFDIEHYTERMFGMFWGEAEKVTFKMLPEKAGIFYDRFGSDIIIKKGNDGYYYTQIEVNVSDHFIGWILALGNDVTVTSPPVLIGRIKTLLKDRMGLYARD